MGRADKQVFLRLLLDDLEEIHEERDEEKREAKLVKTIEHVRDTIED